MPALIYKKKTYAGATMPVVELTKAQYDALPTAKKMDGTVYLITDDDCGWESERSTYDNTESGLAADNVQAALDEIATEGVLYLTNVPVSATTGDIVDYSDARITPYHVLAECVWANSAAITTSPTWSTDVAGKLTISGTCTSATTANVVLVR